LYRQFQLTCLCQKSDEGEQAIDHGALLEGFDGDRRLLKQIVRLFVADYPRRLAEIKEAINRGDGNALARAAHALKGSGGKLRRQECICNRPAP